MVFLPQVTLMDLAVHVLAVRLIIATKVLFKW